MQRHDEIQTFKPETYWVLRVTASTSEGRELPLEWKRIRCFEKEIANMFLAGIKEIKEAMLVTLNFVYFSCVAIGSDIEYTKCFTFIISQWPVGLL